MHFYVFGRPLIKRFALCCRTVVCPDVCLSCLSVTLVHYGQTVGRVRMPLGTEVGLGPGDIVLDGDPARQHGKEHSRPPLLRLRTSLRPYKPRTCLLWSNVRLGWIRMPLGTNVPIRLSVSPSVCLSITRVRVLLKRLNISHKLQFSDAKILIEFQSVTPMQATNSLKYIRGRKNLRLSTNNSIYLKICKDRRITPHSFYER